MKKIAIYFSVVCLIGCSSGKQLSDASPTTNGLIAYYTFEDNMNDQVGGNHAKPYNSPSFSYVNKAQKKAVKFSVQDNSRAVIDNTFDYKYKTICFRVRADVIDNSPAIVFVSDNPRKQYGLVGVVMMEEAGQKKLVFNIARNPVSIPVVERVWYHITLVGAGKNYGYYLNGSLIAKGSFDEYESSGNGAEATILGSSRMFHVFFSGSIDDLRIYNRVLKSSEIAVIASN
jgi:hypothetical protein